MNLYFVDAAPHAPRAGYFVQAESPEQAAALWAQYLTANKAAQYVTQDAVVTAAPPAPPAEAPARVVWGALSLLTATR